MQVSSKLPVFKQDYFYITLSSEQSSSITLRTLFSPKMTTTSQSKRRNIAIDISEQSVERANKLLRNSRQIAKIQQNSQRARIWNEIKFSQQVDASIFMAKQQKSVNLKRKEIETKQRSNNIEYLNKWAKFKKRRVVIIKEYVKAKKLSYQIGKIVKLVKTR